MEDAVTRRLDRDARGLSKKKKTQQDNRVTAIDSGAVTAVVEVNTAIGIGTGAQVKIITPTVAEITTPTVAEITTPTVADITTPTVAEITTQTVADITAESKIEVTTVATAKIITPTITGTTTLAVAKITMAAAESPPTVAETATPSVAYTNTTVDETIAPSVDEMTTPTMAETTLTTAGANSSTVIQTSSSTIAEATFYKTVESEFGTVRPSPVLNKIAEYNTNTVAMTGQSQRKNHLLAYANLVTDLTQNYNVLVPSFTSLFGNNTIAISVLPVAVLGIIEVEQVLLFQGMFRFKWLDKRISWNPEHYGGLETIELPTSSVWIPKILIVNSAEGESLKSNIPLLIHYTGYVVQEKYGMTKTTCEINTSRYPFDAQRCKLSVAGIQGTKFNLVLEEPSNSLGRHFLINSEWLFKRIEGRVTKIYFTSLGFANVVEYTVTIQRKSLFYLVSIIFPIFLLSFMTAFVFLFPLESDERLSYLISIFVSYAIFLNFITECIPRTSSSISNMETYLLLVLIHCATAIIVAAITQCLRSEYRETDSDEVISLKKRLKAAFKKDEYNVKERCVDYAYFTVFLAAAGLFPACFCL